MLAMAKHDKNKHASSTKADVTSIRHDEGVAARLDVHVERLRAATPGSSWSRSSAALNALLRGLDLIESEEREVNTS